MSTDDLSNISTSLLRFTRFLSPHGLRSFSILCSHSTSILTRLFQTCLPNRKDLVWNVLTVDIKTHLRLTPLFIRNRPTTCTEDAELRDACIASNISRRYANYTQLILTMISAKKPTMQRNASHVLRGSSHAASVLNPKNVPVAPSILEGYFPSALKTRSFEMLSRFWIMAAVRTRSFVGPKRRLTPLLHLKNGLPPKTYLSL
jgi:hypothetical protein